MALIPAWTNIEQKSRRTGHLVDQKAANSKRDIQQWAVWQFGAHNDPRAKPETHEMNERSSKGGLLRTATLPLQPEIVPR